MKHLTVEGKTLIVGDAVADALTEYAAVIARTQSGDTVDVHAITDTGDETVATIVFTSATSIIAETVSSTRREPGNEKATAYLRERIDSVMSPPMMAVPESPDERAWSTELEDS